MHVDGGWGNENIGIRPLGHVRLITADIDRLFRIFERGRNIEDLEADSRSTQENADE